MSHLIKSPIIALSYDGRENKVVITLEIYQEVRRMALDGFSQRQIAKTLHISRNTVKKYYKGDTMPDNRKEYKRNASVLQVDVVNFVKRCLETDAAVGLRKQHHTAKRIYDRLVDRYNFTGC